MARLRHALTNLMRQERKAKPTRLYTWIGDEIDEIIDEANERANRDLAENNQEKIKYQGNDYYLQFEIDIVDNQWTDIIEKTIKHNEFAKNINDLWNFPMADFDKKITIKVLKKFIKIWEDLYEKDTNQH